MCANVTTSPSSATPERILAPNPDRSEHHPVRRWTDLASPPGWLTGIMSHWSQDIPSRVWDCLACPYCGGILELTNGGSECGFGHHFDLARHGYVSLLGKQSRTDTADTADMVQARSEFLEAGHYAPIAAAVATAIDEATAGQPVGPVLEIGAGTGYYLARSGADGAIALDSSRFAARRAARALPGLLSVVADAWDRLPVQDRSLGAVLSVFAPRNRTEIHRVLRPGGLLVVVTPEPAHLSELVDTFGMLSVDVGKADRLAETFGALFKAHSRTRVEHRMELTAAAITRLVLMGPSAWHLDAAAVAATAESLGTVPVTVDVTVSVLVRPAPAPLHRVRPRSSRAVD